MSTFVTPLLELWAEIFVIDFLRYAIPAALLTAGLALFSQRLVKRRIQQRKRTTSDTMRELKYSICTVFIFSLVGLGIGAGEASGWIKIVSGREGMVWQIANMALIILLHDAYFYWTHRAMHHPKLFRLFHRTHHLSRTPAPWAAYSFAPLEAVVEALFLPLYLLLIPTHIAVIVLFLLHMIVRNVMAHAGVELFPKHWLSWPLLRHITVTSHHDLHHEHFRGNYGFYFNWWDRWMGTEHPHYRAQFERLTQPTATASTAPARKTLRNTTHVCLWVGALMVATLASPVAQAAESCALDGHWVTEGFGAVVEIRSQDTPASISGTIRWVLDPAEQTLLATDIFSQFAGSGCRWHKGLILNPASGRRYRSSMQRLPGGMLRIKGCLGPFCQTQTWYPYPLVLEALQSLQRE
ncbi:MAG: sterol desaturase family protein [Pseudomonadota bacterium]